MDAVADLRGGRGKDQDEDVDDWESSVRAVYDGGGSSSSSLIPWRFRVSIIMPYGINHAHRRLLSPFLVCAGIAGRLLVIVVAFWEDHGFEVL